MAFRSREWILGYGRVAIWNRCVREDRARVATRLDAMREGDVFVFSSRRRGRGVGIRKTFTIKGNAKMGVRVHLIYYLFITRAARGDDKREGEVTRRGCANWRVGIGRVSWTFFLESREALIYYYYYDCSGVARVYFCVEVICDEAGDVKK